MKTFAHENASSVEEAVRLLVRHKGKAKLNAGGTDLLGVLKDRILPEYPAAIINLKTIPQLNAVAEYGSELRIGALATLSEIVSSPVIAGNYALLQEAARTVASLQIRNIATIGGNLAQDSRCWYYRYPHQIGGRIDCFRKGGKSCPAVRGETRYHSIMAAKKCFAVCPSDTAVALTALGGKLTVAGEKGEREIPVEDFYEPLGNALKPDEVITRITVPKPPAGAKQRFLKFTLRKPIDFAIVSVGCLLETSGEVCKEARICLGAVAPKPVRAFEAENFLKGKALTEDNAVKAAEIALQEAKPLADNAYKVEIAKTLVKRALGGGE